MAEYITKEQVIDWFSPYGHLDKPIPCWQIPGTIDEVTHWQYLPQPPKGE